MNVVASANESRCFKIEYKEYEEFCKKATDLKVSKLFSENLPLIILYATITVCTLFLAAPILIELVGEWYKASREEVEDTVRKAESVFIKAKTKREKEFSSDKVFTDVLNFVNFTDVLRFAEKRLDNKDSLGLSESVIRSAVLQFAYDKISCKQSEALKCNESTGLLMLNLDSTDESYLDLTIEEYLCCVRLLGKYLSELEKNILPNQKELDVCLIDLHRIDITGINVNETLGKNINNQQVKKLREIGHMLQSDYKHSKRILEVRDIFARDKQNSFTFARPMSQIPEIFDLLSSAPTSFS